MLKLALAFCFLLPTTAFADNIDGAWCVGSSRVEIKGPHISLNGKPAFEGNYVPHELTYIAPAGEDHAGDTIYMRLMDDEDMTSFIIKNQTRLDTIQWKRC